MYHKKTVFILGAGASYYYGYPLGNKLIPYMLDNLNDLIPVPAVKGGKEQVFYNESDKEHGRLYDFKLIKDYLLKHDEFHEKENHKFGQSSNRLQIFDGYNIVGSFPHNNFYGIRMGDLDIFHELENRLLSSNPISIDSFLRNNPDLNEAAKTLIIYTLLKCENPCNFNLGYESIPPKKADAWLSILFNELTQGCSHPRSVLDNNVHFVTFNYDVSLEYFFARMFKETRLFSENADELIDFIQTRTQHVYGHLPTHENLDNYGCYSALNPNKDKTTNQFHRFLQSLLNYESILTINEERANQNHEIIKKLIKDAEVINIIGFAFDRDNLNTLGFPNSIDNWANFIDELEKTKIINYLNFDGTNTKLKSEFDRITSMGEDRSYLIPNESKAKTISDALLYDFKSFLFE